MNDVNIKVFNHATSDYLIDDISVITNKITQIFHKGYSDLSSDSPQDQYFRLNRAISEGLKHFLKTHCVYSETHLSAMAEIAKSSDRKIDYINHQKRALANWLSESIVKEYDLQAMERVNPFKNVHEISLKVTTLKIDRFRDYSAPMSLELKYDPFRSGEVK